MGCGVHKAYLDNNVDKPLNSYLVSLSLKNLNTDQTSVSIVETFNSYYERASEIIRSIEDIREILVDKLDRIIFYTSAGFYKEPDLAMAFRTFIWKVAADYHGEIRNANIEIHETEPFIEVKSDGLSSEGQTALKMLNTYISSIMKLPGTIKEVDNEANELVFMLSNDFFKTKKKLSVTSSTSSRNANIFSSLNTNSNVFEYNNEAFFATHQYLVKTIKKNTSKIRKAIDIYPDLTPFLNKIIENYRLESSLFVGDINVVDKANQVGMACMRQKVHDFARVARIGYRVLSDDMQGHVLMSPLAGQQKYQKIIETKEKVQRKMIKNKNKRRKSFKSSESIIKQ